MPYKTHEMIVAFDLDGTLAVKQWPGIGEPIQGALAAVRNLHDKGVTCLLFTYRISPYFFSGKERPIDEVLEQEQNVRTWLNCYGLSFMKVWTGHGKPNYHLLVDDRAVYFPGKWTGLLEDRIAARLGIEEHE